MHANSTLWPGFYAGGNKWIIPAQMDMDFKDITWDNKQDVIRRELEKNGIYIDHEVQITTPSKEK
jgi:hypothetical protein